MSNFNTKNFKIFLNSVTNPSNPRDTKIKNYRSDGESVSFSVDFEDVDVALRIAGLLGKHTSRFNIHTFHYPDTNKIDYVQFVVHQINDAELLTFIDSL
ncbi:hypothetical protein [Bacillus licheniformis]|uniref:hypothetical protein n=1 Tax=Bacillus licheniformis TaxID=1402 RepID=UPI0008D023D1|nr:hypothetical protein [Bacillus licheniformis]MCI4129451.1 hypothetical protein [Bacillus haynesii]OLO19340.1 hypothetical protein BKP29_0208620 [Bacillus licheniformis]